MTTQDSMLTPRQQALLANWLRLKHLPPVGYRLDPTRTCFVLDPVVAPLLRRAWELVLAGMPVDAVLRTLNGEMGFRTPIRGRTGGKPLARGAFYRMLRDPFYCGRLRWEGGIVDAPHEPLVTVEEFASVQARPLRRWTRAPAAPVGLPPRHPASPPGRSIELVLNGRARGQPTSHCESDCR